MADKVEFVITGRDQSAAALNSFRGNADSAFKSATAASRAFNSILTGGGILLAFRTLEAHLSDVAERFKTANAAAANYATTSKLIKASIDQDFLFILEKIAPLIKEIGDYFDPAARATKHLADATRDLKDAEAELADARNNPRSGLNAVGGASNSVIANLEAKIRRLESDVVAARASAQAARKRSDVSTALDPTGSGLFGDLDAYPDKRKKSQQEAAAQAKSAADSLAKYNEDLVKTRIDNEKAAAEQIAKYNADVIETRNLNELAAFEDAKKADAEAAKDRLKAVQDQAQAFGEVFAANLIQSGETGFKGLLKQFEATLIQMVAVAEGKRLFEAIFPKGFSSGAGGPGGWVGGIASVLGFAGGGSFDVGGKSGRDANFVPLRLTRGEHVEITPQGGNRGGAVINQQIYAAPGTSPADLRAVMVAAQNSAVAEIDARNRKRGRR